MIKVYFFYQIIMFFNNLHLNIPSFLNITACSNHFFQIYLIRQFFFYFKQYTYKFFPAILITIKNLI